MFGLTALGIPHTAISLIAVTVGFISFFRYREISSGTIIGKIYLITTVISCLTGFGIFQHGGFGKPHALGILTLMVLMVAATAEYTALFKRLSPYVRVLGYSATFLFHWIPAITETTTRLPLGAPLLPNADAPELKVATGMLVVLFIIGAALQVRRMRTTS